MFNSVVLDVVVGLVFVYLLYSLMATLLGEIVATNLDQRGRVLKKSIERMLNDSKAYKGSFAEKFYHAPAIKYLSVRNKWFHLPAYISADLFSTTLINLLRKKKTAVTVMEEIRVGVSCHDFTSAPETRTQLLQLIEYANGDVDVFKKSLEDWFNEMQDRASGWFKRRMQIILLIIGLGISLAFNVDSIRIADILVNNNEARYKVLALSTDSVAREKIRNAMAVAGDTSHVDTTAYHQYTEMKRYSEQINDILGLGWAKVKPEHFLLFKRLHLSVYKQLNPFRREFWGIIITALALSLGAPFWFGLLNKLIVLRGSGKNTDAEKEKQADNNKDSFKQISTNLTKDKNSWHLSEYALKDPVLYAIAMNEQQLKTIPGVTAVNKDYMLTMKGNTPLKNPCIEVIHTDNCNVSLIPSEVSVLFQGARHTISIDKRSYGYATPHLSTQPGIAGSGLRICNEINKNSLNGWGTLTGIIRDAKTGKKLLFGCAHVLQGNNTGGVLNGTTGISENNTQTIGTLSYYLHTSIYDIAWGQLEENSSFDETLYIRQPRVITSEDADALMDVTMYGAVSGKRTGMLWNINTHDVFEFPAGQIEMFNLLKITSINSDGTRQTLSQGGDSGAILRDANNVPVGMVIGGNAEFTYAIKLSEIFNDYKNIAPVV